MTLFTTFIEQLRFAVQGDRIRVRVHSRLNGRARRARFGQSEGPEMFATSLAIGKRGDGVARCSSRAYALRSGSQDARIEDSVDQTPRSR